MLAERFNEILDKQLETIKVMLGHKAKEYATTDRLHNFKKAAALKGETPRQALMGMMVKHTVSVYDMGMSFSESYPPELWDEKITDHINYLILLRAIVAEEHAEEVRRGSRPDRT
jgi:hypothetical protein